MSTVLYNRALPYNMSQFSETLRYNNAYLKLERQELNFEKEVFFKRRFRILLKSILTNSDKRYKLLKTVAFFKLVASSVFIGRDVYGGIGVGGGFGYKTSVPEKTKSQIEGLYDENKVSGIDEEELMLPQGDHLIQGNSFFLLNRKQFGKEFPSNVIQNGTGVSLQQPSVPQMYSKWIASNNSEPFVLENDIDMLDMQVDHHDAVRDDLDQSEIKRKANLYRGTSKSQPKRSLQIQESSSATPKKQKGGHFSKVHTDLLAFQKSTVVRKLTPTEQQKIKQRKKIQ